MKKTITLATLFFLFVIAAGHAQSSYTFTGKPIYQIVTKRAGAYLGTIKVELFPNIAPNHVRNFDSLVSFHFYDTTAFHRVVPGFVIQGGDPNSRHGNISTWGYGQPGQPTVDAEFTAAKHIRGRLSAARSANINSATSQFFICVATAANLDGNYSLYGKVTSGMNIVDSIVSSPCYTVTYTSSPQQKIEMFVTRVGSNDTIPNTPALTSPANAAGNIDSNLVQLKWTGVSDAILYHIEVANDSLFTDTIRSRQVTSLIYSVNGLTGNSNYYWRVRANNGGHFSAFTPYRYFHTKGETTGLQTVNGNEPVRVFPNPSLSKFSFSNIERGSTIQVFDTSGRQVYETVTTDVTTVVDLSRKDKGEYFYKISHEKKQVQKGKLILQ